nr:Uncharacterised protein [Ipomoea batatas]
MVINHSFHLVLQFLEAAKTPLTLVIVVPGLVKTYPSESNSNCPFRNFVAGSCPIAKNKPETFKSETSPKVASSIAESPPPITAKGLFRKIGAAPSQTAQADMPRFQKSFSPGNSRRLATAPVATMTESARAIVASENTLKGLAEKSTLETVSVKILVPNRIDCLRKRSVSSRPSIPSGNPGKFSTSVVVDGFELGAGGVDGSSVRRGATADDTKAGVERSEVIHGGDFGGGGDGGNWDSAARFSQSIHSIQDF